MNSPAQRLRLCQPSAPGDQFAHATPIGWYRGTLGKGTGNDPTGLDLLSVYPLFRSVRQCSCRKRHPVFRDRSLQSRIGENNLFPRQEMSTFSNNRAADPALDRTGANRDKKGCQNEPVTLPGGLQERFSGD